MPYFLTEEEQLIQQVAKQFAEEEVGPVTRELDKNHEFPTDLIKRCAELQFLGLAIPEEYGGAGAGMMSDVLVMEQIARYSSSLSSIIDAHAGLACSSILYGGTEEQKKKYLTPAAKGECLAAFALTEPEAGSDAGNVQTYAVLDGDEWVLNGTKCWITNLGKAKIYVVAAKTDREAQGSRGISLFIVEEGTPGFEIGKPEEKLSNHSSYSGQLFFKDVRIPKENLVGQENKGFSIVMKGISYGRIAISAVAIGIAQGAYERSVEYSKGRVQFGKPICKHQTIQFKLAEMATSIEVARSMLYRVARMADKGLPFNTESTMLKMHSSEMCNDVCYKAIQVHGGNGLSDEYEIERFYRDARLLTLGEGTSEICRMIVGGAILAG